MKIKEKCEICKCLNLISEGKKHPSPTVWRALTSKFHAIQQKNPKAIASFCYYHRSPLLLVTDFQSISGFIEEVFTTIERYLNKIDKSGNYKFKKGIEN
jgi:hypothetical protein